MQESESQGSHDDARFDEPSASDPREESVGSGTENGPSRPVHRADPVARWLALAIAGVVIFWLVAALSAVMFGLLTPAKAPRTLAERDLAVLGVQVQGGQADSKTYAQYIETLIQAGQLSKAQEAIDQGLKTAKNDRSWIYAEQAQLQYAAKDYPGTVAAADKAIAEAKKELAKYVAANVAANRRSLAGATLPDSYLTAALAKAEALAASKDYAGAVKAFDVYLKEQPIDADILVQRGDVKILIGDKMGAAADFRAALKYIPDFQPALDGLKQIGAGK